MNSVNSKLVSRSDSHGLSRREQFANSFEDPDLPRVVLVEEHEYGDNTWPNDTENPMQNNAETESQGLMTINTNRDYTYKLTCSEIVIKYSMLAYSLVFDFGLIFADWFMDLITGAMYFWEGEYTFGVLCWIFPIISGTVCSAILPNLLKKYDHAYEDFDSRFLKNLSRVPSFQPIVFSYHYFKAGIVYPTQDPRWIPHLAHIQQVTNHLVIVEGILEATPQAILQMYIYIAGYETVASEGFKLYFTATKILLSIISMSRVIVKYWQQDMPIVFLEQESTITNPTYADHLKQFWGQMANALILLPYHVEAFTLSCGRIVTIVFALLMLSDLMTYRLTMSVPEPKLLIPLLTLILLLVLPRLLYSVIAWSKCVFYSSQLQMECNKYEISKENQKELVAEYYYKFLKRAMFSIFAYPFRLPIFNFLVFYSFVETLLVFISYTYWYGVSNKYITIQDAFVIIFLGFCIGLITRLYEFCYLSRPKKRYVLARKLISKCQNILQKIESQNPPKFVQIVEMIKELTEFYNKRIMGKNFITTRGMEKVLNDPESIFSDYFSISNGGLRDSLLTNYGPKIAEDGNHLVFKELPLWRFMNHFCCQVMIYYASKYMLVVEKYNLNDNLRRLREFKTVDFNLEQEDTVVFFAFPDLLEPLTRIAQINYHNSPTYAYIPIQNFTKFEFPLGQSSVSEMDSEKLAYILKGAVAVRKLDWNLADTFVFMNLFINEADSNLVEMQDHSGSIQFIDEC